MAGSFLTDHDQKGYDSNEVRFMHIPQERPEWSCSIGGHGLRRDLVISGSAQMVKDFIVMIQEEFTLKHVNFLTSENSVEFLGRTIKRLKNGNITMEFSQKFIDELLKIFEVTGKVTTTGLKFQALPEDQKVQCDQVIHQKYRSAVGKLLWMAQLRDDLKYPVKELSRSLINPQDQDVKNLVHLLKYVNQTRDFVFVMEPQLPVRNQEGKFPVQIVSYSDSDWAGCQKSRDQRQVH